MPNEIKRKTLDTADAPTEVTGKSIHMIKHAQQDMCTAYLYGSTGVLASGLVWLLAGFVAIYISPKNAVWTLLIGGVFIHPVGVILNKMLGASGAHTEENPLGRLAIEGTIFMLMCIPIAYVLSFQAQEWFFQGMLLIIGGRYLTFATLYGTRLYWILGMGLGIAAYLLFYINSTAPTTILVGSAIEITFGFILLSLARKKPISIITS